MSFAAYLRVCGDSIPLNYSTLEISQDTDVRGRPNSIARGGTITVEFDTIHGNDAITAWMADPVHTENGSVVYMQTGQESVLRSINFSNALCVEFHERFDGTMSVGTMTTMITIVAPTVNVGGIEVDNHWEEQG